MARKIAVLGAGPSGLVAIKTFKDAGHHVECFESQPELGGLWNYDLQTDYAGETLGYIETKTTGKPMCSSYKSLQFITLSYTNIMSDYIPDDWSLEDLNSYLYPNQYKDYLLKYTEHFNLRKHIRFNSHVVELYKSFAPAPGWIVKYDNGTSYKEAWFDFVMIGTGAWSYPYLPHIPSLDNFKGLVIHSSQVRNEEKLFKNKNVLVIGAGFSGVDMVKSALKSKAENVYLAISSQPTKRNHWILDRFIKTSEDKTVPWQTFVTRDNYLKTNPLVLLQYLVPLHLKTKNSNFHPNDFLFVNDSDFVTKAIKNKTLRTITKDYEFSNDGKSIYLSDGTVINDIDIVIFGTGFLRRFPYLDALWPVQEQLRSQFYKNIIPTNKTLDGLGFLCMLQGQAGLSFIVEIQCQWICATVLNRHYNADGSLYTHAERIEMEEKIINQLHSYKIDKTGRLLMGNPFEYVDGLAKASGYIVPTMKSLLNQGEVELAVALYHGPLTGAQYRLRSDNSAQFEKAKKVLITVAKTVLGEKDFQILLKHYYNAVSVIKSKL